MRKLIRSVLKHKAKKIGAKFNKHFWRDYRNGRLKKLLKKA